MLGRLLGTWTSCRTFLSPRHLHLYHSATVTSAGLEIGYDGLGGLAPNMYSAEGAGTRCPINRTTTCCFRGSLEDRLQRRGGAARVVCRESGILSGTERVALPDSRGPCGTASGGGFAGGRLVILPSASAAASPGFYYTTRSFLCSAQALNIFLRRAKPSRTHGGAHCPAPSAQPLCSQPIPRRAVPPLHGVTLCFLHVQLGFQVVLTTI